MAKWSRQKAKKSAQKDKPQEGVGREAEEGLAITGLYTGE